MAWVFPLGEMPWDHKVMGRGGKPSGVGWKDS